ncbi:MAG: PEP-CTERM sorting domain-containing protein [Akkermansiaceae bacterium]|jgi:hypothetical protein
MRPYLFSIFSLSAALANGAAVTNWVATNGDAGFTAGTAATNSPVSTDADGDTLAGSFASVTLGEGDLIALTGSVSITGNTGAIPGNQFRWGLFGGPGTPTTGNGSNYVGIWASASTDIRHADGSTTNPFSGSASTIINTQAGAVPAYGDTLDFSLNITRINATQISVSGDLVNSGGTTLISWPETTANAAESAFTFNSVGILLGGTTDATQAAFSNVDATLTSVPEPSSLLLGLIGILGLLRRRR